MVNNTYRSSLMPYENEIVALRRKRPPMSFPKIAAYLREKHQITVHPQTILDFLKVRTKGCKPCKYAWDIEPVNANNQPTTEVTLAQKAPSLQTTKPVVEDKPNQTVMLRPEERAFDFPFSETYNLHRVSPEEAAARLKKLEEKRRI